MRSRLPGLILLLLLLLSSSRLLAQSACQSETSLDDEPQTASAVTGDCISGTVGDADAQDLWRWSVSDGAQPWRLSLTSAAGTRVQVEIIRVTWEDDGLRVRQVSTLYSFGGLTGAAESSPLLLSPGEYFLGVAGAGPDAAYRLTLAPGAPLPASGDTEPNDRPEAAQPLASTVALSGSTDSDWFRWSLTQAEAAQRWQIAVQAPLETRLQLRLYDSGENLLLQTDQGGGEGGGHFVLHDLGLPAGSYLIHVDTPTASAGVPYSLTINPDGPRQPGREEEPNGLAQPFPFRDGLQGRLTDALDAFRQGADVFSFAPGAAFAERRTTLTLTSDSPESRRLCLYTQLGVEIQCRSDTGQVSLRGLSLVASAYLILVDGRPDPNHRYTLTAAPGAPLRDLDEREPNDGYRFAPSLPALGAVRGAFDGLEDDVYRFVTSGGIGLWRIQAIGKEISRLSVLDAAGRVVAVGRQERPGTWRISEVQLLPGTHFLSLRGRDGSYVLRALFQGEPDPNLETEPNNDARLALPLAFGQTRRGILAVGDQDSYRFRLKAAEWVRLTVTPPADGNVRLRLSGLTTPAQFSGGGLGEPIQFEGRLLPDDYTISLNPSTASDSAYAIQLERLNPFGPEQRALAGVTVTLAFPATPIAAYSPWWQSVAGTITLRNTSRQAVQLHVDQHTTIGGTDPYASQLIPLDAGETLTLPLSLTLPPDVVADVPLVVTVRAAANDGRAAFGARAWEPSRTAQPVGAAHRFALDDRLLGAINVASTALGAEIATEDPVFAALQPRLHNSHALDQAHELFRFESSRYGLPQSLTVDLAGDSPLPVTAIALHPQGAAGTYPVGEQLAAFELWLSADGRDFTRELVGSLEASRSEQTFLLPAPVPATHARLVLLTNFQGGGGVVLDEWKVLVAANEATGQAGGWNLADVALGGQLVSIDLPGSLDSISDMAERQSFLTEDPRPWNILCREECGPLAWVIGFHEGRAALIDRLIWVDSPELGSAEQWPDVAVYASDATPLGPWKSLGILRLTGQIPGEHALDLAVPAWARYVRFVVPISPDATFSFRPLPAVIRVIERVPDASYRSILGEWGWQSRSAALEWLEPPQYQPLTTVGDAPDSAAAAVALTTPVTDWVERGRDEDWFALTVPAEQNTIELTLSGQPAVDVALELFAGSGDRVPLQFAASSAPNEQRWRAAVQPGETYRARIYEPPRSIIFAWDTSGSVSPFHPIIYQALARFAAGVTPGQEAVNLWPFGSGLILERWEDDPSLILSGLQDDGQAIESSQTAESLLGIAESLASRSGKRAVVLVGDMDLVQQNPMALWRVLGQVQPRVFALRVAVTGRRGETAIAHWAAVRDGDARDTPSVADLELGFDRAATRLRRPSPYALSASYTFSEPPGPGTLRVVSQLVARDDAGEIPALGNTAVEIILDASGSMLQALGGLRRIDIARETLVELATDILPPGTPVALRVFGHVEGNYSCRTDLVVPLQPLDPEAMAAVIGRIEPKNLANTAIAASLRLAADDLSGAEGRKVIILLTDGEETCDGDPAAAIQGLRDEGLDVRVNIVGFAIADESLKATFETWAQLGNGGYYDAGDATELNSALNQALRAPFRVLSSQGEVVAEGLVNGDPITLAPGVYRVEIQAEPTLVFDPVIVPGDDETVLTVATESP